MKQSPMPRRRTRLKAVNPARRKREFARCYGSAERVAFVRSLPCEYCRICAAGGSTAPSDNAHTEIDGMGRKAHYTTIVPLCRKHHRAYDEYRGAFADPRVRAWLRWMADVTEAAWQRHQGGAA